MSLEREVSPIRASVLTFKARILTIGSLIGNHSTTFMEHPYLKRYSKGRNIYSIEPEDYGEPRRFLLKWSLGPYTGCTYLLRFATIEECEALGERLTK